MKSDWWHPHGEPEPSEWDETSMVDTGAIVETSERFHIGQGYEKEPAKVIACRICGGTIFKVAQGSYFTAIKCIACEWEKCIHDG